MSRYRVYEDDSGKWRWQLVASNGENVGGASESYRDKTDTQRGARDNQDAARAATIEVDDA